MMTEHGRRRWGNGVAAGLMLATTLTAAASPVSAQGRKYALLIGVGDYIHSGVGGLKDLDGPPHDVSSLRQALRRDWGFDHVTSLVDRDATRAGILRALDDLIRDTRPGDYVFVYFSGHGTSSSDRQAPFLAGLLDPGTGALLPADVDFESSELGETLLVGRRDLRPRLQELDRDRDVFVVFDACYSADTARFVPGPEEPSPKYVQWPGSASAAFGSATRTEDYTDEPYPYENLVYLSASAKDELAGDVGWRALNKKPTIDGRPHGILTDGILRGLSGEADTDGSGELTVRELHRFVRSFAEDNYPQTPQLLVPAGRDELTDRPVFRFARGTAPPRDDVSEPPGPTGLRVALRSGAANALRGRIGALDGVSVVTGEHDLSVDSEGPGVFTVRHGSGDRLTSVPLDADEVAQRVERQALIHDLLDESFPTQDYNVELDILDVSTVGGEGGRRRRESTLRTNAELFVGRRYEMTYGADVPAYFLLLSVDVHGVTRLLVPWTEQDLSPVREGRIPDLRVSRPTGTEFVKLFAFRERPAGLDAWLPGRGAGGRPVVRAIESRRELDALLRFVRDHAEVAAETVRKFVSAAVE